MDYYSQIDLVLPKQLPLKQGLKQEWGKGKREDTDSSKATSIKTRIETIQMDYYSQIDLASKATSIKTRIETPIRCACPRKTTNLPKQLPLKQGLKQYFTKCFHKLVHLPKQLPLKQGLKLTMNLE